MGKTLVIAEKPLAGKKIADVLGCTENKTGYIEGERYIVTWADGHLVGLKYPEDVNEKYKKWDVADLPITIDLDKLLYILPEHKKQFEIIKSLIHREDIDCLINAGDSGREGYLIQHWIYQMAGNTKPVKVLWAASLTEQALKKAFNNLHDPEEFEHILEAAIARALIDWLLGMNYSRLLTGKLSADLTLPYGRCIITLLNMVVSREKLIEAFEPEVTYFIEATYKSGQKGILLDESEQKMIFLSEQEAAYILKQIEPEGIVSGYKSKRVETTSGALLNLTDLQGLAGKKFGYTPTETLKIAQSLYEKHHLITYPRTDSRFLSTDLKESIMRHLDSCNYGKFRMKLLECRRENLELDEDLYNDMEIVDHHAIIPEINPKAKFRYEKLTTEERNVYELVVLHFLQAFCRPYVYQTVQTDVLNAGFIFRGNEQSVLDYGYRALFEDKQMEEDNEMEPPELEERIQLSGAEIRKGTSSRPTRYNVGNITKAMEEYGIGTPATMAATIEKLVNTKFPFLVIKKGKYYSTPFARCYLSLIPEELKYIGLSAEFEDRLKEIERGQMSAEKYISEIIDEITVNLDLIAEKKRSFKPYVQIIGKGYKRNGLALQRRFNEGK